MSMPSIPGMVVSQPSNQKVPIDLIGCRDIEEPGYYKITSDLSFGSDEEDYCIDVYASDVIIDGQGHSIKCREDHQEDCDYVIGIGAGRPSHNITIKNMIIYQVSEGTGIDLGGIDGVVITGVQISGVNEGINYAGITNSRFYNNYFYSGSPSIGPSIAFLGGGISSNVSIDMNTIQGFDYSFDFGYIENSSIRIYNNYIQSNIRDIMGIYAGRIGTKVVFSIPKTLGTNRIGGPYLGGNYWAKLNGRGISQTCSDNNRDGLCDVCYSAGFGFYDFYPLTYHGPGPLQSQCNIANS